MSLSRLESVPGLVPGAQSRARQHQAQATPGAGPLFPLQRRLRRDAQSTSPPPDYSIFGIGNGAPRISGPLSNAPRQHRLPHDGSRQFPTAQTVVVNFPSPGAAFRVGDWRLRSSNGFPRLEAAGLTQRAKAFDTRPKAGYCEHRLIDQSISKSKAQDDPQDHCCYRPNSVRSNP